MDAMYGTVMQRPRLVEASPFSQSSSSSPYRSSASFIGFCKAIQNGDCRNIVCGTAYPASGFRLQTSFVPIRATAHEKDDTGADQGTTENGLGLASEDSPAIAVKLTNFSSILLGITELGSRNFLQLFFTRCLFSECIVNILNMASVNGMTLSPFLQVAM